jgi:hypothetical protein
MVGTLPRVAAEPITPPPPPLINPHFHLSLAVAPGAQLRAPQLQASTTGSFSLLGTLDRPYLHGNMTLNSGKFLLPTAVFKLERGGNVEVEYAPQNAGDIQTALVEHVDLTASAIVHISPAALAANQPGIAAGIRGQSTFLLTGTAIGTERYIVTAHIVGALNDPESLRLDFTSSPVGLTQQQILAALGGVEFEQFGTGDVAGAFKNFMASALSTSLSDKILANFSEALGLEDFSVDYSPEAPLSLTVVKQLSPRLDFTFVRYVNSRTAGAVASTLNPLQYQAELGYNLKDRFKLRLSTDDQNDNSIGIEGVFHF